MHSDNSILLSQISALCMLFFYNIHLFSFLRKIIKNASQSNFYIVIFALINIFCAFFYNKFFTNYIILFYFITFLLSVECTIFSKGNYRQSLFAATSVSLHMSLVYLPVPIFLSTFLNITPIDLVTLPEYRYITMFLVFAVLELNLYMMSKFIKKDNLIIVSTAKFYSEAFTFVCLFMCTYIAIDCILLISDKMYSGQFLLSIVTSLFTISAYYSILLYTIDLVAFAKHKRQSDLAEVDYNQVLIKKNEIVRKNTTDDLTGLYNRKFIYKNLNELCLSSKQSLQSFAILYLDVNGLKFVNDTYGHEEGDRFLKNAAIAIRRGIREDDYPARIGGDEFIVIVNNIIESDVEQVIDRIESNFQYFDEVEKYPVSASIGFLFVTQELRLKGYKYLLEKVDKVMRNKKAEFYQQKVAKNKMREQDIVGGKA